VAERHGALGGGRRGGVRRPPVRGEGEKSAAVTSRLRGFVNPGTSLAVHCGRSVGRSVGRLTSDVIAVAPAHT